MNISILSVFPQLYTDFLKTSLVKRAQEESGVQFDVAGFSSFCEPKERLDGPTAGHGTGMAIRPEVMERAVAGMEEKYGPSYKIFLTPQGKKLDQTRAKELGAIFQEKKHILLVAGRYEGVDERAQKEYADLEISIGDYVLMGGDLPAMVLLEAVLRYVPGVVGKAESVEKDSFTGAFVDFTTFTIPPREWQGRSIPEVLLSGNHALMDRWRHETAAYRSVLGHFQWVRSHCVAKEDRALAARYIPAHYVVLLHDDVIVQDGVVGTSSVTSLDIHDIARSAKTYGMKEYFVVTSLKDQQKIVHKFLEFWHTAGIEYNRQRHEAIKLVTVIDSLEEVIQAIEKKEGKRPLLVGTSARKMGDAPLITYHDQERVWESQRPVLLLFGTAKGVAQHVLERCDFLLLPIEGFTDFNHLSVRSAAAVILDRWVGINLS